MRSLWDILPGVIRATEDGKLTWESNTFPGSGFYSSLEQRYRLEIWKWTDPDSDIDGVTVALKAEESKTALASTILLNNQAHGQILIDEAKANQFDPKFAELDKLFSLARRSALKVDAVIGYVESVLSRLNVG